MDNVIFPQLWGKLTKFTKIIFNYKTLNIKKPKNYHILLIYSGLSVKKIMII